MENNTLNFSPFAVFLGAENIAQNEAFSEDTSKRGFQVTDIVEEIKSETIEEKAQQLKQLCSSSRNDGLITKDFSLSGERR